MGYDFYIDTPIHKSELLHPHINKNNDSLPVEFLRSAAYTGAQEPVSGVVQMVDKTIGTNMLPSVQFIAPCDKAQFGTLRWHTQQFGAMLGVTGDLLALSKGVGAASNKLLGRIEDKAENEGALAIRAITDSAATGFIHNGLFRPVGDPDGNFYAARFRNAMVGAGSFAIGTASSLGIKHLGKGQDNMFGKILRSDVGSTVLSGIPSGFAYAEMKSLAEGEGLAPARTVGQAIYSFSVLGGVFTAGKELLGRTMTEENLGSLMRRKAEEASAKKTEPATEKPIDFAPTGKPIDAAKPLAPQGAIDASPVKPVLEVPPIKTVLEASSGKQVIDLSAIKPVIDIASGKPAIEVRPH